MAGLQTLGNVHQIQPAKEWVFHDGFCSLVLGQFSVASSPSIIVLSILISYLNEKNTGYNIKKTGVTNMPPINMSDSQAFSDIMWMNIQAGYNFLKQLPLQNYLRQPHSLVFLFCFLPNMRCILIHHHSKIAHCKVLKLGYFKVKPKFISVHFAF